MRFKQLILPLLFLAAALAAHGATRSADADHVHVELVTLTDGLQRGSSTEAGLWFKLEAGWHIYWKNAGDAGEPPHLRWTMPSGISATPLQFPAPKRLPLGPLMDYGYEGEVLLPFTLRAESTTHGPATLKAHVDWLVCQDRCIPGKADLELAVGVSDTPLTPKPEQAARFRKALSLLPVALPKGTRVGFETTPSGYTLTVETGRRESTALFFPADDGVLSYPAAETLTSTARGLKLGLVKDSTATATARQLRGVLELSGGRSYELAAMPGLTATAGADAAQIAAAAPVAAAETAPAGTTTAPATTSAPVPMPVETPTNPAGNITLASALLAAFVGGLILNLMPCVFPVLFLKGLSLAQSGAEEHGRLRRHGLVYTAGIVASFWVLVGVLLALRAAGSTLGWGFQFQSPVFLALMASLLFFLGLSLAGQFEIGLSMTSAGGSLAQKQGYTGSFFTGVLAVVVATPCTAPFMGAAIGFALAQPPVVTFAVFTLLALGLAAPYVVLTVQPAWTRLLPRPGRWMEILRQAVSVPIFATVIWMAWVVAQASGASTLAMLLAGFLLLAVAGWFLGQWPLKRWATVVAAVLIAGVVGLAIYGSQLATTPSEANSSSSSEWQPWTPAAQARALASGQMVFVDYTASWCLSCQVNERVALGQPQVRAALTAHHAILLRADWTRHDEAITQALTALGRSGVPTYVVYRPGDRQPHLLPEALTPQIVLDALDGR